MEFVSQVSEFTYCREQISPLAVVEGERNISSMDSEISSFCRMTMPEAVEVLNQHPDPNGVFVNAQVNNYIAPIEQPAVLRLERRLYGREQAPTSWIEEMDSI
jgi:hypothetical protein